MGAKLLKILMVTLLSITLISCGETDQEKLEKKADNLVEEYNSLIDDLNYQHPSMHWSDDQLDSYGSKLNRLENVYDELMQLEADNHELTVFGGYNTREFISNRRSHLSIARSEKELLKLKEAKDKKELEKKVFRFYPGSDESLLERKMSDALILLEELSEFSTPHFEVETLKNEIADLAKHHRGIERLVNQIQANNLVVSEWSDAVTKRVELLVNANEVLELLNSQLKLKRGQLVLQAL